MPPLCDYFAALPEIRPNRYRSIDCYRDVADEARASRIVLKR